MPSPDKILEEWAGMIDNDFQKTIQATFDLPEDDDYVYQAESFAMTLAEVQERVKAGNLTWAYKAHGHIIIMPDTDISAYTTIFASTSDTAKALRSFASNAKKGSPRESVATYLLAKRQVPDSIKVSKVKKAHRNPYYDVWVWSCHATKFLGPLDDPGYAHPTISKQTHPILPVLYHHFGCVCPSFEALSIISQLVSTTGVEGVIDMASGSGYWTFLLRKMGLKVTAVDNMEAVWRTLWIDDTVKANGVDYLKTQGGARNQILMMIYMVTAGDFTKQVLRAYKGDWIVIVGTQNANRYTSFADVTVEEYFAREQKDFELSVRIALPSFAGKDEAMYVYQKKK